MVVDSGSSRVRLQASVNQRVKLSLELYSRLPNTKLPELSLSSKLARRKLEIADCYQGEAPRWREPQEEID